MTATKHTKKRRLNEIVVLFVGFKSDEKWELIVKHSLDAIVFINMLNNGDKLQPSLVQVVQRNIWNKFPS